MQFRFRGSDLDLIAFSAAMFAGKPDLVRRNQQRAPKTGLQSEKDFNALEGKRLERISYAKGLTGPKRSNALHTRHACALRAFCMRKGFLRHALESKRGVATKPSEQPTLNLARPRHENRGEARLGIGADPYGSRLLKPSYQEKRESTYSRRKATNTARKNKTKKRRETPHVRMYVYRQKNEKKKDC